MQEFIQNCQSSKRILVPRRARKLNRLVLYFFIFLIILMFLPWTQNIRTEGKVTTLTPNDRPQSLVSIIDGKIENWYIKEGDIVKQGDTLLFLSEIKEQYFDPKLLERTKEQINAKQSAINSYERKVQALNSQIINEKINLENKLKQAKLKVQQTQNQIKQDSAELKSAIIQYKIAKDQLERGEKLFKEDLISLVALEQRRAKEQETAAKEIFSSQKLSISMANNLNAITELNNIQAEYMSKIYKIESEIQTTNSDIFKSDEELSKLNNQYSNYAIRNGNYYLLAPRNGQIVRINKAGFGETVKQGEEIATIASSSPVRAVELYVNPVDLPLIKKGNKFRIIFDGWPTIFFSGWPGVSYGTFGGEVAVIDNNISENGKYRVLIKYDPKEERWPEQVMIGGGARGIALLNNVSIGYEIWRNFNGFPPDFYYKNEYNKNEKK